MTTFLRAALIVLTFWPVSQTLAGDDWLVTHGQRKVVMSDAPRDGRRLVVVENGFYRLALEPDQGGRASQFLHKRTGQDLTRSPREHATWGLLADQLWQEPYEHNESNRSPYTVEVLENTPRRVMLRLGFTGTIWRGVRIVKTLTASADSSALRVDYEFTGDETTDARAKPNFWLHQTLPGRGRVYFASPTGVQVSPRFEADESWVFEPTRSWVAWLPDTPAGGTAGLAVATGFDRLLFQRATHTDVDTIEWIMRKTLVRPGQPINTTVTLAPLTGLDRIDGVGDTLAVGLEVGAVKAGQTSVRLGLASFADQHVEVKLSARRLPDGAAREFKPLTRALKADRAETVDLSLPIEGEGSFVIEGLAAAGAAAPLRFERLLVVGEPSGLYAMSPEGPRVAEEPDTPTWSRYSPKDLDFSSLSVSTPHRAWARPYAGGRPRVLALLPGHHERQAIELAQRFDMDLTCSFLSSKSGDTISTYYVLGDRVRSLKVQELTDHLDQVLSRSYDVILTSYYDSWALLSEAQQKRVLEMVEAGTGLVVAGRGKEPEALADILPLVFEHYDRAYGRMTLTEADNPVLKGLPYEAMPYVRHCNGSRLKPPAEGRGPYEALLHARDRAHDDPIIGTSTYGRGRVVQMCTGTPLIPPPQCVTFTPDFDYDEYQFALIGRLVYWAARKESPVAIEQVLATRKQVEVQLSATKAVKATVTVTLRDRFGEALHQRQLKLALGPGNPNRLGFAPPSDIAAACLLADVSVEGQAGVLAWGAGAFTEKSPTTFASLTTDKPVYDRGDRLTLTAKLSGEVPLESSVRLRLYDGFGRLLARAEADAFTETKLDVSLSRALGPVVEARAEYLMNGVVVDQARCEATIRVDPQKDRIKTAFWGWAAPGSADMIVNGFAQFARLGMNANFGNRWPDIETPAFNRLNMTYSVQAAGMYTNTGTTKAQRLNPADPSKPQVVMACANFQAFDQRRQDAARRGEMYRDVNSWIYSCGDENRGPVRDICFSDTALENFRHWLKTTQYSSLEELNAQWKTSYTAWEQVMPMTEEEVRSSGPTTGSYAPWADQRQFNKWAYARMAQATVDGVLSTDPDALIGESGTQESDAYGGRDWWHLARVYNALTAYGGTQEIEQQSFNPALLRYPWGGYSKPAPIIRAQLWDRLGSNNQGFCIFSAVNHINPDFTLPEVGRDLRAAMLQINRGPGQMLVAADMANAGVYILQSPMSIHGAFITDRRSDQRAARDGLETLLDDLAIGYRAVSYEQLADGHLEQVKARVLILPHSLAMSDKECAAVSRFVAAGGTVIADVEPAVMTEHCLVRDRGALVELWGRGRAHLLGSNVFGTYQDRRKDATDSEALGQVRKIQDDFTALLGPAGVTPALTVRGADGLRTPWINTAVKDAGPIRYVVFMRDYASIGAALPDERATVAFDREAYVYDALDGAALGRGRALDVVLVNNTLRVLSLLPYEVTGLQLNTSSVGRDVKLTARLIASAPPATHWLRMDVVGPDGSYNRAYSMDLRAVGGVAEATIPFAFNDAPGSWRVTLTDAATGVQGRATIELRP